MKLRKLLKILQIPLEKAAFFAESGFFSSKLSKNKRKNPRLSRCDADQLYRISRLTDAGFTDSQIVDLKRDPSAAELAVKEYLKRNNAFFDVTPEFIYSLQRAETFSFDYVSHMLLEHEKLSRGPDGLTKKERREKSVFTVLGSIFIGLSVLSLLFLCFLVGAVHIDVAHPKIAPSSLFLIFVSLIPTFIVLGCGIRVVTQYRKLSRWDWYDCVSRRVKAVVCIIIALTVTLLPRVELFLISLVPLTYSETCDTDDYMVIDEWVGRVDGGIYSGLFPSEIPEEAEDARYYYHAEYEPFDYCPFEIFAEWKLDGDSLEKEIDRISSLDVMHCVFELGSYKCYSVKTQHNFNSKLGQNTTFFAFNRDKGTVRYVYYNNDYDHELTDSYFMDLEW